MKWRDDEWSWQEQRDDRGRQSKGLGRTTTTGSRFLLSILEAGFVFSVSLLMEKRSAVYYVLGGRSSSQSVMMGLVYLAPY